MIPLAAEDYFMEWINLRFIKIAKDEAWSEWLKLLQLVYNPHVQEPEDTAETVNHSENNLIDVEIFDDTEPNIFDETIYTAHKCFNFMLKNMNGCPSMDLDYKEKILAGYVALKDL